MNLDLRPMSSSQLLDRTFQLYLRHFPLFIGIAVPSALMRGLSTLLLGLLDSIGVRLGAVEPFVSFCSSMVGDALILGATIYAVSAVHLGRSTTILEVYRKLAGSFARVLKVIVLVNFRALWLILSGLLLMVLGALIPVAGVLLTPFTLLAVVIGIVVAIWAYFRYAIAVPACVAENLSPREALRRSSFLTDDFLARILLIQVLGAVVAMIASLVINGPWWLNDNFHSVISISPHAKAVWKQVADLGSDLVAGPVRTIALSLFYYDMRVRKEAFDLQLMMDELDSGKMPAPVS